MINERAINGTKDRIRYCMDKKTSLDIFYIIVGMCSIVCAVLMPKSVLMLDGDKVPLTYAVYVDIARAIHSNSFSLWNPYLWGGVLNIGHMATQAAFHCFIMLHG